MMSTLLARLLIGGRFDVHLTEVGLLARLLIGGIK